MAHSVLAHMGTYLRSKPLMITATELPTTTATRVHGQETMGEVISRISTHLASRFGMTGITVTAYQDEEHAVSWISARGPRITAYYKHIDGTWGLFTLSIPHTGVLSAADSVPPRAYLWEHRGGLSEEDLAALHALPGLM